MRRARDTRSIDQYVFSAHVFNYNFAEYLRDKNHDSTRFKEVIQVPNSVFGYRADQEARE